MKNYRVTHKCIFKIGVSLYDSDVSDNGTKLDAVLADIAAFEADFNALVRDQSQLSDSVVYTTNNINNNKMAITGRIYDTVDNSAIIHTVDKLSPWSQPVKQILCLEKCQSLG